jgi:predicted ATPase/Tfp pilus assembly protein PilF
MSTPPSFADVLNRYVSRSLYTAGQLHLLTRVPEDTIVNWLKGRVRKPRNWQELVKIAKALHLSMEEADMLLQAAGHPPIRRLRKSSCGDKERALLKPWSEQEQDTPDDATQMPPRPLSSRDDEVPDTTIPSLPGLTTSFIGRVRELETLRSLVYSDEVRLLTLAGPGGVGKTRLAMQAATHVFAGFRRRIIFVPLASTDDPELVIPTIAQAISIQDGSPRTMIERLSRHLDDIQALLILDSFEHLLAAAPQIAALLAAANRLKILVTSRTVLRLSGEHEFVVPPLTVPDLQQIQSLESLQQNEAVQLFVARAQAKQHNFALTKQNARAVAEICQRLDGLPLAIELAASQIKVLVPSELLRQINRRFDILIGGGYDVPERHRTLQAALDWSFDRLTPSQQLTLAQLSVFCGSFTLAAVESVCSVVPEQNAGAGQVRDQVIALLEQSLVRRVPDANDIACFDMLEIIRAYATDRLQETGQADRAHHRHARYYADIAEQAADALGGPQQNWWLTRLEHMHDDLRTALQWTIRHDALSTAARIAIALWRFWFMHGHVHEGRSWIGQILLHEDQLEDILHAKLLNVAGILAHVQGDFAQAQRFHEGSLLLRRKICDQQGIAASLSNLGLIAEVQGDHSRAIELHTESLSIEQALGNSAGIADSLNNLGNALQAHGDYAQATACYEASLVIRRELGDTQAIAASLHNLGDIAYQRGDLIEAHIRFEESLIVWRELEDSWSLARTLANLCVVELERGDHEAAYTHIKESLRLLQKIEDKHEIASCLIRFAGVCCNRGDFSRAARLFGAAEALRKTLDVPILPGDHDQYERDVARTRTNLSRAEFARLWASGQMLSLPQIIQYALEG